MVSLQVLTKILNTKDYSIVLDNSLTEDYFEGYKEEFNFIDNHYKQYGQVPDKETFLSKFKDIPNLHEVSESDRYLIDTLQEEYLFRTAVPVVQKIADLLQKDSNMAVEYMLSATKQLQPNYDINAIDIVHEGTDIRYEEYIKRRDEKDKWYFTTGFPELDEQIHGIQRGEELIVLFARVNQGKSWVLEKLCSHVWQLGFNVGYISPEMSASSIGYRFDTLLSNFSNRGLMWGNKNLDEEQYKKYLQELNENKHKFVVSTPLDFNNKITVSKIRNYVKKYKLDLIAIDGIKYITDERYKKGDNTTTSLTNISEDLMSLSMELKIPVLVVVQANRQGVNENGKDGTPDLDTIRDSDGISHNASKVVSLHQNRDNILELAIKKQRFGPVGGILHYRWGIDTGEFVYIPSSEKPSVREKEDTIMSENNKQKYVSQDVGDVF